MTSTRRTDQSAARMNAHGMAASPRRWRVGFALLMAAWCSLILLNQMRPAPTLGPVDNRLQPCPASPNCVCSQDSDSAAAVAPLSCPGPATATQEMARLRELVLKMPRTRCLDDHPGYLRFEVTTGLFRFRDDLEFLADDALQVIHVRSASRLGYSDLGTNRRRVETIRRIFSGATSTVTP